MKTSEYEHLFEHVQNIKKEFTIDYVYINGYSCLFVDFCKGKSKVSLTISDAYFMIKLNSMERQRVLLETDISSVKNIELAKAYIAKFCEYVKNI